MTQAVPPRREQPPRRRPPGARLPRRGTDRVEEFAALVVVLLAMAAVAAAVVLGTSTHTALVDRIRADAAHRSVVTAVLTEDPPRVSADRPPASARVPVPARWADADGREHTGVVPAPGHARVGTAVDVWVDRNGEPVGRPVSGGEALLVGWVAGILTLICAAAFLRVLWLALLRGTRSVNDRAWAQEWARVEPWWSGRRGHDADRP
ncbi:MAG: hypothetical protein OJJ54_06205 [Pseudonocardia sp.]|nr:hypothetical protein [Pseudonocardia sp.]